MPGAIIVINQDRPGPTTSNGTPGVARKDLWQSRTIRPVCSTSGNSSLEWTLLDVPAGSAAVIAGTESAPYFTPDLPGPYRLLLVTNGGGPGNMQVLICGVTFDEDGVELDGGAIYPAYGEEGGESNWAGNERGWATSLEFVLTDTRTRLTTIEENPGIQPGDNAWLTSLSTAASGVASDGFVRTGTAAVTLLMGMNGVSDAPLLRWSSGVAYRLTLGDEGEVDTLLVTSKDTTVYGRDFLTLSIFENDVLYADADLAYLRAPDNKPLQLRIGAVAYQTVTNSGVGFFTADDFANGTGVVAIGPVDTPPDTDPDDSVLLYNSAGVLMVHQPDGSSFAVGPSGGSFLRPDIATAEVDYHLDEASGTIINYGTLGNAADMGVGAASTASVRYGYPGPFGNGLRMPTGSTLESPAVATAATDQMTIWAWIMTLSDSPGVCSVLAYTKTAAVSHLFSLSVGINGSLYVQYDNGSGGQQALNGYSEEIILRQRPTLICVVYDVTPVSVGDRGFTGYIDGVKVGFYNLSGTVNFATSARWQLGSTNGAAQTLNAIVFAAGSVPYALDVADIEKMYRDGKAYP